MRIPLLALAALLLCPAAIAADATTEVHGISVFGKLKYPSGFKHFDYVNPDAPRGGEVKVASIGTYDSLNPFIVKGNKAPGLGLLFESLMTGSADEPQSMYGLIASSAIIAPDRSYAEFILRPEAKFQDGSAITADDVMFSFDALKKDGDPSYRVTFEPISSVVKIDDHRVRFNFKDKTKRELPLIAGSLPILSKAYYSKHDFAVTTLEPPLASGPYKIASVDQGRSIVYERVKDYWGAKLPVNVGQNNFDRIRYDVYRDENVAIEALKAGAFDLREENIARAWATAYDTPAVHDGRIKKELVHNEVPQGMQGFIFNLRRAKFDDRRVREAIGLTLDFEWMNKTTFYSQYERDKSYFQNTDFAAKGVPQGEELALLEPFKADLPPELFTQEFHLAVTDGSGDNRPQLLRADKLLTDAGWVVKNGVRVNAKTGEPFTFEFLVHIPAFEKVVAPMRKHLKQLGIDASIRVVDTAQYQKRIETFDFDIVTSWFNQGVFYPGTEQMAIWNSTQADQQGSDNVAGLKSKVVDMLLAKITSARTEEELGPPARALDRVLLWEHYMIPQWGLSAFRVAYWDKFGRPKIMPKYSLGFPGIWWMKDAKN